MVCCEGSILTNAQQTRGRPPTPAIREKLNPKALESEPYEAASHSQARAIYAAAGLGQDGCKYVGKAGTGRHVRR